MNTLAITTSDALLARQIVAVSTKKNSAYVGIAKSLLIEEAKRQMRSTSGCRFVYLKVAKPGKPQEVREAFGTLNPQLCGKHINGRGSSPENHGCTCYWDMERGGFRSFRWENLVAVLS